MNLMRSVVVTSVLRNSSKVLFSPVKSLMPERLSLLHTSKNNLKTFEPDYLDAAGPQIPVYPPLNIQIKGYNFDVLETTQSWIHNLAENMGIEVEDAWATPAKTFTMTTYLEGGTRPKDSFEVAHYERNVQVVGLRSVDAPILIDAVRRALPEGVTMSLHEHTVEMAEERWIADPFIDSLRSELSASEEEKAIEKAKREATAEAKAARKREQLLKSLTSE